MFSASLQVVRQWKALWKVGTCCPTWTWSGLLLSSCPVRCQLFITPHADFSEHSFHLLLILASYSLQPSEDNSTEKQLSVWLYILEPHWLKGGDTCRPKSKSTHSHTCLWGTPSEQTRCILLHRFQVLPCGPCTQAPEGSHYHPSQTPFPLESSSCHFHLRDLNVNLFLRADDCFTMDHVHAPSVHQS